MADIMMYSHTDGRPNSLFTKATLPKSWKPAGLLIFDF